MADVVKKVDPSVPRNERHQTFTDSDASADDIILVKESLGKHATKVIIDASGGAMSVRFNVYQTQYPPRGQNDGLDPGTFGFEGVNLSDPRTRVDETADPIAIGSGDVLEFDDDLPVKDIQIVTAAGAFSITCI